MEAEDEEEIPTCPLCLEELDSTDRAVKACQCGYQVCLWCLHHIREQLSARCPACRTPYEEQNFKFAEVNPEQAAKEAKERATAKKERERKEKLKEIERERARAVAVSQQKAKSNLKHARIVQKNLVYVIGLSLTLAREEVIRRADMFGGPSISAYVQYYRDSDASAAVRSMNNAVFDGREIRCAIATTKYCDVFVRNAQASDVNAIFHCANQHCMYYHSMSPPEAVLTREEVLARQLGPPPPAHLFFPEGTRPPPIPLHFHRPPPPLPLTGTSAPNTSASAAASAVPASRSLSTRAPAMPSSTAMPSVSFNSHTQVTSNASPTSSLSEAIPTNAYTGISSSVPLQQQPMASSPRARALAGPATGRKPGMQVPVFSPAASPQRTPPASPPRRRSLPRLTRSPGASQSASSLSVPGAAAVNGNGMGSATASAAPFFSPPASSAQLPSTAGWGSSHGRSSSRSPPRRSPSTLMDDPSRTRSRVPLRRLRDNAPPGFEDAMVSSGPPGPSRPPGFDNPPANHPANRTQVPTEVKSNAPPGVAASAPPGFGPGPAVSRGGDSEECERHHVAAAWSQEASTDEVFSTQERRSKKPVGQPGQRSGPPISVQNGTDSVPALALLLAQRGKETGVSTELEYTKTGPLHFGNTLEPVDGPLVGPETLSLHPQVGVLFRNPPFKGSKISPPASHAHRAQVPKSPVYGSAFSVPITCGAVAAVRHEAAVTPRRRSSRFDFARQDIPERSNLSVDAPNVTPHSATAPPVDANRSATTISSFGSVEADSARKEGHPLTELTRTVLKPLPTVAPASQVTRQSRSRFDFADHNSSPPKSQEVGQNSLQPTGRADAVIKGDPSSDAYGETFASLSTAEKLASIFNSAQWSGERLPPMPALDPQVDQVAVLRPEPSPSALNMDRTAHANPLSSSGPDQDRITTAVPHSHPIQFAPPGFREATPGISPETTAVDKTSTTTGVATKVASGGTTNETSESPPSGHPEESLSSGTESLEEDRKRSRAQRKRDKKARQLREAAEKKAVESRAQRPIPVQKVDIAEDVKDRVIAPASGLREIKNPSPGQILSQLKEPSNQFKPNRLNDDPSRFMSVPELEREVELARAREAQLQDRLQDIQRRIRSYDNVRT